MPFPSASATSAAPATWSVSRDKVLQTCERKYFFQYLAGGRLNGDTPRIRQIGLLKKLKSVPMWLGDCFHQEVAQYISALRDGQNPSRTEILKSGQNRVERDWRFSVTGRYRQQPYSIDKAGTALLEHHYGEMPGTTDAASAYAKLAGWLDSFLRWSETAGLPQEVAAADRIWIEPPAWGNDAPGFADENVQIVTKVDFAWERAGEAFVIYDWKASEPPRTKPPFLGHNELQVGIYQLWPHLTLGIDLAQISSRLVYCGGAQVTVEEHRLDPETLPLVRSTLRDSIRLGQRWAERLHEGQINLQDLNYAGNLSDCRLCGFRELCRADSTP